jgi:hypothetical protein
MADVRFGSKADIPIIPTDVRFVPKADIPTAVAAISGIDSSARR